MYGKKKMHFCCFIILLILSMIFLHSCKEGQIEEDTGKPRYEDVRELIKPKGDPLEELLGFCRYFGMTAFEIKGLFGKLIPGEYSGGGRRFEVEFIPGLFFNFPVAEWAGPDDDTRSLSFDSKIGVICPSITERITPEQFRDIFELNMRIRQSEEDYEDFYEGDYIISGYHYIKPELLIERYDYAYADYWADKVAISLVANLKDNPIITPDTIFSIGPVGKSSLPSFAEIED